MNVALLPAKPLRLAKTRLGTHLGAAERAAVSAAMFADVLAALTGARHIDRVLVVTADALLAERARHAGALAVPEPAPRGLNAAVALGTQSALDLGATAVLVVLSDVPLIEAADVDALLADMPERGALVVPSKEGTGTNAIARRPPALFPPCFGGHSLERHRAAAAARQVPCVVVRNARIELDVDTVDDLRTFAAAPTRTTTREAVTRLHLGAARPSA